ncbi:hypothetical protein [Phaeodactylibacter xiamenensis]|uniref:hypothetical protein n=1 Tax=Phaeodactylibacter xiamenensis TaxID=1524460 RepID=UPI003CCBE342
MEASIELAKDPSINSQSPIESQAPSRKLTAQVYSAVSQPFKVLEVLSISTICGKQPKVLLELNDASGIGTTQIDFTMVSASQKGS